MKIHLNALDINVKLLPHEKFHDDGFVSDPYEHLKGILRRYNMEYTDAHERLIRDGVSGWFVPIGRLHSNPDMNTVKVNGIKVYDIHSHIFYLDMKDDVYNMHIRAHEESHFVQDMGKLRYLFVDMIKRGKIPPLLAMMDAERFADKCADYSISKRGIKGFKITR